VFDGGGRRGITGVGCSYFSCLIMLCTGVKHIINLGFLYGEKTSLFIILTRKRNLKQNKKTKHNENIGCSGQMLNLRNVIHVAKRYGKFMDQMI
jgi:hypothetical protein